MRLIGGGLVIGALIVAGLALAFPELRTGSVVELGPYYKTEKISNIKTLLCMWESTSATRAESGTLGGSMKFEGHVEFLPDRKYKVTKADGSDYTIVVPPINATCVISKTVNATETTTSTKPSDINT